jgi:hypothetical protein
VTDSNGNFQINQTYPPTTISPAVTINGVTCDRTISVGSLTFYVASDNSQLIPKPTYPTATGGVGVATQSVTLRLVYPFGSATELGLGSDGNVYALQPGNAGHFTAVSTPSPVTPPITVNAADLGTTTYDRKIIVNGQVLYVSNSNFPTIVQGLGTPATGFNAVTVDGSNNSTHLQLSKQYSGVGTPGGLFLGTDNNFYTETLDSNNQPKLDASGNNIMQQVSTASANTSTVNGVSVQGNLVIAGGKAYFVSSDNSQVIEDYSVSQSSNTDLFDGNGTKITTAQISNTLPDGTTVFASYDSTSITYYTATKNANNQYVVTNTYPGTKLNQNVTLNSGVTTNFQVQIGNDTYYPTVQITPFPFSVQINLNVNPLAAAAPFNSGITSTAPVTLNAAKSYTTLPGPVRVEQGAPPNDGNYYALKTDANGNLVLNSSGNAQITATYPVSSLTQPLSIGGVTVDRSITVGSDTYYVAQDNSALVPASLQSEASPATSDPNMIATTPAVTAPTVNVATTTGYTQTIVVPDVLGVPGNKLYVGADQNLYAGTTDSNGNFELSATYTPTSIPQINVAGVNVNRTITLAGNTYYIASDNSELILKSYAATDETASVTANGSTVSLSESYSLPTATVHFGGDGNFYTVTGTAGNYQVANKYTATPINPVVLADGVLVNRTILVGTQYFYVAADNSQIVPEPVHPGQNEIFTGTPAATSTPVNVATTTNITQSIAVAGVPGGKLYVGADQNLYAVQVDSSGKPITDTYTPTSIPQINVDGVNVNRTITLAGKTYYIASDNSELIFKSYAATDETASVTANGSTVSLSESYSLPTATVHFGGDGNFYTVTGTAGNYQVAKTYTATPINPVVLADGVLVNRTIQIGTQYFYVAGDNSQIVPEPVHPGQNEVSASAMTTTMVPLQQAYSLPGVPGQLHFGSDGNFYSLQVDANGNPVLDAQNRYQVNATYKPTTFSPPGPTVTVAGVLCDRTVTVNGQVYYVGENDKTTGVPPALIPANQLSQTIPSSTGSGTIATISTLTPAAQVTGLPLGIYASPSGNFYSLQVDNSGSPLKDANGNDRIKNTYQVTKISPTTVNGVPVNGTITVTVNGTSSTYYVTTSGNQLVSPGTSASSPINTTTLTLEQAYTLPGVPGQLHFASDGNFYSVQVDANGNPVFNAQNRYQLNATYKPTYFSPSGTTVTVAGVVCDGTLTLTVGNQNQVYYVGKNDPNTGAPSALVPANLLSQVVPTTSTTGTIATTSALTQAYQVPGIVRGIYASPDGNFYSLQVDNNGKPKQNANGNYLIGNTYPVTKIAPTTVNGVNVSGTITVTVNGTSNTYYVATDGSQLVLPVTSGPTVMSAPAVRNMDLMEFIYYWNEAKMHVLKAQLAYQNDITQEMQESLRQANAALADLEQQSSQTTATDKDSKPNPNTAPQTVTLHLFAAENQVTTTGANGGDGSILPFGVTDMNYGQFAKSRTALQNFIDRRSADAQSAMVDYQNTLNTFNNNYNTMSQLQQKLEDLLTQELRNWN